MNQLAKLASLTAYAPLCVSGWTGRRGWRMTLVMSNLTNPLPDEMEQFDRNQAARAEARHIVLQWLQEIETARSTGQALAELGYATEGLDIAIAAVNLEIRPPIEYLQRLIDVSEPQNWNRGV